MEFMSFLNLDLSTALRTKSELLHEEGKHDFVNPDAITKSMTVSSL